MNMNRANLLNAVREYMVKRGLTHTALVLDALYTIGARINRYYTVIELHSLLSPLGVSEKVIRSATHNTVFRSRKRHTAGRAAREYFLPSAQQVAQWFPVRNDSQTSDTLPVSAFQNAAAYRAAMHETMISRLTRQNGGKFKMSRLKMYTRLGVCANTIRNYERKAPIEVTPYIVSHELVGGIVWDVPAQHDNSHAKWLRVVAEDGSYRNYPNVRAIAAKFISAGCRVFRMTQRSNLYQYMTPEPPQPQPEPPPIL